MKLEAKTSALEPAGPAAEAIADLWWIMLAVSSAFFVVVMFFLIVGLFAKRREAVPTPPLGDKWFISIGGLLIPGVLFFALLVYTLMLTAELWPARKNALTIQVTGYMWWWDVRYPASNIVTANEIYIPAGEPVRIELRSADVIHSLWVPSLAGKIDLLPGITNDLWLEAKEPGTYRGQCAEYCGIQHARMSIYVVALPKDQFEAWIRQRQHVTTIPQDPKLRRGLLAFKKVGCAECHAIRGSHPAVNIGPDLTHIGSRLSLGAATIPNNHGNLAGWIANPQALKPGNKMPATYMDPKQLEALVAYLMSLK